MAYKIVLMRDAQENLDRFVTYLLFEKKSEQTARNLLNDFEVTKVSLTNVAGSLKLCDNPKLRELGYHRINFLSHRYFMLYRIENDTVYVDITVDETESSVGDFNVDIYASETGTDRKIIIAISQYLRFRKEMRLIENFRILCINTERHWS